MKPESTFFKEDKSILVEFPFNVSINIVDKLIKTEDTGNNNWKNMYM